MNDGNVWILGMKTEGPVTAIKTVVGSTELVGGLHYAATLASLSGIPLFINDAGKVSYTYLTTQQEWPLHAYETRDGLTGTLENESAFHQAVGCRGTAGADQEGASPAGKEAVIGGLCFSITV